MPQIIMLIVLSIIHDKHERKMYKWMLLVGSDIPYLYVKDNVSLKKYYFSITIHHLKFDHHSFQD
jgi:hypothetical protein